MAGFSDLAGVDTGSPAHLGRSAGGADFWGDPFFEEEVALPEDFFFGLSGGGLGWTFDFDMLAWDKLAREPSPGFFLSLGPSWISEISKTFLHLGQRTDFPCSSGLALNFVWQWTHCANVVILSLK